MMKITITTAIALAVLVSPVLAKNSGKLPENAKPLTSEEVKQLYVGKTLKYKDNGNIYYTFTPDGKLLGLADKTNGTHHTADGTWTVNDNVFCFQSDWKDQTGKSVFKYSPCQAWFRAGKTLWTKNVSGVDDQYAGDIYTGEAKNISKGDQVSKRLVGLKAQ
ncbi:DUF995 domain-containing protein [Rhizobium sp. BR 362]|uniref:DUF995 domain-containing protein n=1 Tax=Rhizobium sp. BR 362 TaxID=3040670 RepID=UPI002F42B3BF